EQIVHRGIGESLAAAGWNPHSAVRDISCFHHDVSHDLSLQRDIPLVDALRPAAVRIHICRGILNTAPRNDIQPRIVRGAVERHGIEDEWLRKESGSRHYPETEW